MNARRWAALSLAAALATLAACSKVEPPVAPEPPVVWVPPGVEVTPPVRGRWVPQDSRIHARWDVKLDTTSVDTTTVYLKIDAKRYNCFYSFDDSGRGLTVTPAQGMLYGRTYTVEITRRVLREDGTPLYPNGWFWQFTITSIRAIDAPDPPDGAINTSPFHRLRWNQTDPNAGPCVYTVFKSTDSSAVTRRVSAANAGAAADGRFVPTVHWDYNRYQYWAVRVINQRTGQVYESPTFKFRPVAQNAPVDSFILRAQYWGSSNGGPGANPATRCNTNPFLIGPTTWSAIRWLPPNVPFRFQSVRWYIQGGPLWTVNSAMSLRAIAAPFDPCQVSFFVPNPRPIGNVLVNMERGANNAYLFRSEAWTSQFEADTKDFRNYGYLITSAQDVQLNFANPRDPTIGAAVLVYYK